MASTVCFSVLHFRDHLKTIKCVDSLLRLKETRACKVRIVIVDNGSDNDSAQILQDRYSEVERIAILSSTQNLGFAKGNNIGFDYAKHMLKADACVFLNNDIEVPNTNFAVDLLSLMSNKDIDVLSVDVFDPFLNQHQSPLCWGSEMPAMIKDEISRAAQVTQAHGMQKAMLITRKETKKLVYKSRVLSKYVVNALRKALPSVKHWSEEAQDVVCQGSCVIVGKRFLEKMPFVFYPETFMYFEECILKVICDRNNMKTYHCPSLQVLHHHGTLSKENLKKDTVEAEQRQASALLDSYKKLKFLQDNPEEAVFIDAE